jgi:AAA+ ATPase superfamily predicted ATPase
VKKEILANPYIVGNPIKSRDMFFGREDDFAFVARKIGENRANQVLVLCGERRSGKTSILFQILDGRLGEAFLPVLIDMQMLAGIKGDADFFRAILKAGCALLCRDDSLMEKLEAAAGGQGVERLFEAFLAEVQQRSPGRIVLFLLDEYELIEAKIRDGSLSESTIHYLAGVLESPHRVSFIFTGSTNLEDRRVEVWKSLLGKSIYRKISYLSRGDTGRLITEPVRESVTYTADLVEAIFRLTGGQPFYTQVICQNMVDLLMEEGKNDPLPADLERIVRDIVDNPLPQMIYSWNSLAEWSQVVLASLASDLGNPDAWAGSRTVHRFLLRNRIRLPFKKERIHVLLEEAYHAELLEKDERDAYRFRMDLLRRWISREHSIWKAARETGLEFRKGRRWIALAAAIALSVAGLAALGWFVLAPRFFPALLGPAPSPPAASASGAMLSGIVFTANRGPYRLNIDGASSLTSEGQRDQKTITVESLAPGKHTIVATPREGVPVERDINVSREGQVIEIAFAPAPQKARTAAAASSPEPTASPAAAPAASPPEPTASPAAGEGETGRAPVTEAVASPAPQAAGSEQAAGGEQAAVASEQAAQEGDLVINSKPADASVSIDGQATGKQTPYIEKMPAGAHVISLSLEGYRTATIRVTVEPGQQARKDIALEDAWAQITFDVRPTAQIYLDDAYILDTPYAKPYKVRAGRHVVTIKNEALKVDETITVTIGDGETLPIRRVLK